TRTAVRGSGTAMAAIDGRRVRIEGRYSGMLGAATAVRLHEGALTGVRGPAFFELEFEGTEHGSFHGELNLNSEQAASLRAGRWYIQIYSTAAPEGNLWGWLLP